MISKTFKTRLPEIKATYLATPEDLRAILPYLLENNGVYDDKLKFDDEKNVITRTTYSSGYGNTVDVNVSVYLRPKTWIIEVENISGFTFLPSKDADLKVENLPNAVLERLRLVPYELVVRKDIRDLDVPVEPSDPTLF